jgi:hypothetical protein
VPHGADVEAIKRVLSHLGYWNWQEFDRDYNNAFSHGDSKKGTGVEGFQKKKGIDPSGNFGEATFNKTKGLKIPAKDWKGDPKDNAGDPAWDERSAELYRSYLPPDSVPDLGVVFKGGKTVLSHDLTHRTSGLPADGTGNLWPAFDDAFSQGCTIIAPEDIEVYQASSSSPGDACYAKGKSKIRYWFGHLTSAPAVGTKIAKGKKIGVTCVNNVGGGPHVHVAVNVENLWGSGKALKHHTNYTHGAPKIGDQLADGPP